MFEYFEHAKEGGYNKDDEETSSEDEEWERVEPVDNNAIAYEISRNTLLSHNDEYANNGKILLSNLSIYATSLLIFSSCAINLLSG